MARVRKPLDAKGAKVLGIVFLVFALFFGTLSAFLVIKGDDLQKNCTEETEGVVVSIRKKKGTGRYDHTKYYPTVVYVVGSKTYKHELEVGDKREDDHQVGDIIEILYDPDDPEKACTEKETRTNKIAGGFMVAFSAIQLIAAVFLLAKSKKLKNAQTEMMKYQQDYQQQGYQYSPELDEMNR